MILPNKNNPFINHDEIGESRKKRASKALQDAFQLAEAEEWASVIDSGLEYPENMDEIIMRYYDSMPDRIRYALPLKWFMATGKASESVCNAVKNAGKYKPVLWIGKGMVKNDTLDVFCCIKFGDKETVKECLAWATDYGTAYTKAMKISGRVFQAMISKEKMIAYDAASAEPVIQFKSVYAVQQIYPKIPLSACKRKECV